MTVRERVEDDEMEVSVCNGGEVPAIETQNRIIKTHMNSTLHEGDVWRLIPFKWFEEWREYAHGKIKECSPLDISILFDSGKLKTGLKENQDYSLLPEDAYKLLNEWHGKRGQKVSPRDNRRKVIKVGKFTVRTLVEVYPVDIKILTYFDSSDHHENGGKYTFKHFTRTQSKAEMVRDILIGAKQEDACQEYFDREAQTRTWCRETEQERWRQVQDENQSLYELGLHERGEILCEFQNEDGTWPRDAELKKMKEAQFSSSVSRKGGRCGLVNLGNTCFMNSGIQCLAAVAPLANYFLSGEWEAEINQNNPLGTGGRLSKAFAELIKEMWSGHESSIAPSDVKKAVGQINNQFSGYNQNDSQELISTLLDALHEDQNRVINKPYIELPDNQGRPDETVAVEAWEAHLARNASIITDYFHGQFKSTVRCPDCKITSVTFDPFCTVSLPLPPACKKSLAMTIIPVGRLAHPIKTMLSVKRKSKISDVITSLEKYKKEKSSDWLVVEIYNNRIHKIFMATDNTSDISENDIIVAFELKNNSNPLAIYLEYQIDQIGPGSARREPFTHPFIINVPFNYNGKSSRVSENDLRNLIADEIGTLIRDSNSFKLIQINSYCGKTGVGEFNSETVLQIDEYISKANLLYISTIWESERSLKAPEFEEEKNEDEDMKSEKGIDINQCLKLFTEEEQLGSGEEWYCTRCKDFKKGFKQMQMWRLPPVLLLHLKRFHYTRYFRDKMCDLVHFPINHLNLGPYVLGPGSGNARYNLLSVSNHMGRLGGGHYTASVLHTQENRWLNFNDQFVSPQSPESCISDSAYVLVYVRDDQSWMPK